jgi:hypothetical protein
LTKWLKLDEDGKIDEASIADLEASGKLNSEEYQTWIEQYNKQLGIQDESLKGLLETRDAIVDLEQTLKDSYDSLTDMAKEAVLGSMQKQIDLQQALLDSTNEANT